MATIHTKSQADGGGALRLGNPFAGRRADGEDALETPEELGGLDATLAEVHQRIAAGRLEDADAVMDSPVSVLAVIKSARTIAKRDSEDQIVHIHVAAGGKIHAASLADHARMTRSSSCAHCTPIL